MNNDDFDLGRMMDDAVAHHRPIADPAHLTTLMGGAPRGRRSAALVLGAAACFALFGTTALALHASQARTTIAPGHTDDHPVGPTSPPPTEPSQPGSITTLAHETHDSTTTVHVVEPTTAAPTEPPRTEPATTTKTTEHPTTTVHHEPTTTVPHTEPSTTVHTYEWSARQVYETGNGSPAPDTFAGTAQPGAVITITSEYGGATGTANGNGQWEIHVGFVDAPVGTQFQVHVDSGDHHAVFYFTRLS